MKGVFFVLSVLVFCLCTVQATASKEDVLSFLCGKTEAFSGVTTTSHCAKALANHDETEAAHTEAKCPAAYSKAFGLALGLTKREEPTNLIARAWQENAVNGVNSLLDRYVTQGRQFPASPSAWAPGGGLPSFSVGLYRPTVAQMVLAMLELWLIGFASPYGQIVNGFHMPGIPFVNPSYYVPNNAFDGALHYKPDPALPASGLSATTVTDSGVGAGYLALFQQAANAWTAAATSQSQNAGAPLSGALGAAFNINPFPSGRNLALLRDIGGENGIEAQTEAWGKWMNQSLVTVCSCMCDSESA